MEKVQKSHKLHLIMLMNASYYSFLEKSIFDIHMTIPRIHHVQISSGSDLHYYWHNVKTPKMPKTWQSQKKGLVPTLQSEPDFSQTNSFHEVAEIIKLITYRKIPNISPPEYKPP